MVRCYGPKGTLGVHRRRLGESSIRSTKKSQSRQVDGKRPTRGLTGGSSGTQKSSALPFVSPTAHGLVRLVVDLSITGSGRMTVHSYNGLVNERHNGAPLTASANAPEPSDSGRAVPPERCLAAQGCTPGNG